jgi:hypothetical protein
MVVISGEPQGVCHLFDKYGKWQDLKRSVLERKRPQLETSDLNAKRRCCYIMAAERCRLDDCGGSSSIGSLRFEFQIHQHVRQPDAQTHQSQPSSMTGGYSFRWHDSEIVAHHGETINDHSCRARTTTLLRPTYSIDRTSTSLLRSSHDKRTDVSTTITTKQI